MNAQPNRDGGAAKAPPGPQAPPGPFLAALLRALRAQDPSGGLDGKPPARLLSGYLPVPDSQLGFKPLVTPAARLECFFGAVAREVERQSGHKAQALVSLNREGLGRGVIVVGRLVGALVYLREAASFGFASLEALEEGGERLVAEALDTARRFPDAASQGPG